MAASPSPNDWPISRPPSSISSPRPMRSRTQSISSDKPSTIGHSLTSPPTSVSPQAAFIASSAASQIVTNDHDSHANSWYDQHGIEPAGEAAEVSAAALQLVNSFLDQLLFNFLQISRATTLRALRPAVSEVLKPKLAKDAINNADEELREYLGGGDEEDFVQPQGANPSSDWDLELVWKRTRLRCMVYSSLGDLEEEDEDLYMEQENLEIGVDEQISDVISPAVAIFLTSVMEYMGELTLTVAGQAAYHRMRAKFESDLKEGIRTPADIADRIVVEELDMERVALDRTLGRLWRGWKKRIRSPAMELNGRPFSSRSNSGVLTDAAIEPIPSLPVTTPELNGEKRKSQDPVEETIPEDVQPADIPLPMGDNDIDEIEVPGLAPVIDDENKEEEEESEELPSRLRPKSLLISPSLFANGLPTPGLSAPQSPTVTTRKRSQSLPSKKAPAFHYGVKEEPEAETDEATEVNEEPAAAGAKTEQPAGGSEPEKVAADVDDEAPQTDATETDFETAASELEEATPKAPAAKKRLSRISTKPLAINSSKLEDGDATYETAEIMTSARVSVAGSSSPSISESGRPFSLKRSSSVCSARIIDVTGPKSPSGSRSASVDATERSRPVSLSRTSSMSNRSGTEESSKLKAVEPVSRTAPQAQLAPSRSPIDRTRPSLQNATTISESEEEADVVSELVERPSDYSSLGRSKSQQGGYSAGGWKSSASRHDPSSTKVTILNSTNGAGYADEPAPEVPMRAPGRQPPRSDSIGVVSVERTRTIESDDEPAPPVQLNTSPRQTHTSGSSASSGTGRLKAVRTSEDNGPNRAESVARNFEELIQSNQTITYTLTPENMRDIGDSKRSLDGPVVTRSSRKSEDARNFGQPPSSPKITDIMASAKRSIVPGSPMGRKYSVPDVPTPAQPPKPARMSGQARDARVPSESTAEFAQFIKSTGPPGDPGPAPAPVRNSNSPSSPTKSVDSRRTSVSNRLRYQPRDAAVDGKADNSDLIDFIRQGPPNAANNHRIPKHVAPFRTTGDSEQMTSAVGARNLDPAIPEVRNSQASTSVTENSMPSMQSSVNSSSALLKNKASMPKSNMFDEDDMMPKRKTRRVKDPYAIDFSDEEDDDDELLMTPKPPVKKEESLAEFLKNYNPPPEPIQVPKAPKIPKKKASAPSLLSMSMNRFLRNNGKDSNSITSPKSPSIIDSRSLNSRSGGGSKGFIPIQVNMPSGYDKYGAVEEKMNRPRQLTSGSTGRVPMKKFEPRDAGPSTTRTADLAAFLRDSGPPDNGMIARTMTDPDETPNFSKRFARRKKSTAA